MNIEEKIYKEYTHISMKITESNRIKSNLLGCKGYAYIFSLTPTNSNLIYLKYFFLANKRLKFDIILYMAVTFFSLFIYKYFFKRDSYFGK